VLLPMDHHSAILLQQKKEFHQHPTGRKLEIPFMMGGGERARERESVCVLECIHEIVKEFRVAANVGHHLHHERGLVFARYLRDG
jgi:hypothetical protein